MTLVRKMETDVGLRDGQDVLTRRGLCLHGIASSLPPGSLRLDQVDVHDNF